MNRGIADITPLTLLDFPGKVACILWFSGCNFRCQYCYNADLAKASMAKTGFLSRIREHSVEEFLKSRAGFLDGVVMSGGECSLCPDLPDVCSLARSMGYAVKLDTNGTNPKLIQQLVESDLVQYIALDYKAPQHMFSDMAGCPQRLWNAFSESLDWLIARQFPFEVRTTVHPDLLLENDINTIIDDLAARGYSGTYYLQHYFHTETNMQHLSEPIRHFNPHLLHSTIPVSLRNFPDETAFYARAGAF